MVVLQLEPFPGLQQPEGLVYLHLTAVLTEAVIHEVFLFCQWLLAASGRQLLSTFFSALTNIMTVLSESKAVCRVSLHVVTLE